MNKTTRILLPLVLVGSLAAGALYAKPDLKADKAATQVVAFLGELKDAPRLRLALRHVIRELELTPAQVEAAREVLKSHYAEVAAAIDEVAVARAGLREAIRATPTDDAALALEADAVAAAHRDLILATATLRADLRLILTNTQLAKLETLEARFQERMAKARDVFAAWVEAA